MDDMKYTELLTALEELGFQLNEDEILNEDGLPYPLGESLTFEATGDIHETDLTLEELLMVLEKAHFTTSKPTTNVLYKNRILN